MTMTSIASTEPYAGPSEDRADRPAAALAYELTAAQGFYEANRRTGFLLARWFLRVNTNLDVDRVIPADDRELAHLLIAAARGDQVGKAIETLLRTRIQEH